MARKVKVAAGQMGPIQRSETRAVAVARMLELMKQAHAENCRLIVFPELALTTFFPRWPMEDQAEVDAFFETDMPNADCQPLFDAAKEIGIGFYLGYAELTEEAGQVHHYNTSIIVDADARIIGKYRKVHLPGHVEYDRNRKWQHLEKRYFEVGNLGFPVWNTMDGVFGMCLCNDRRWPETYRVMGLKNVEMVLLGYNTPTLNSMTDDEGADLRMFHNHLSMQAGAYQNSTWVVGAAKAGNEDGFDLMGGSAIIAPTGEIVAEAETRDDELVVAECDLDACIFNKETVFNFAAHRRPEHYGLITERVGPSPN
ncbi:MAG: N-carbamoyl-D-amino-acid hydrolase [Proteobacteria bacterium]|nr:N-carbamoyl-D-amino-acid hydrolase [Pseudomonadota bacterium]